MTTAAPQPRPSPGRIAGQGMLLFSGFGAAQALSFARNALIGHALSKGDFGIAAAITLVLQMVETLTDLGADRLIMQAEDGETPRFIGAAHTLLAVRGLLLGAVMFTLGPALAHAFNADHAAGAFQLAALVPVIKGMTHLDFRVAQRRFDNRPQLLVEVVPQAIALAMTWPMIAMTHDYTAVVWLSVAQATTSVTLSHALRKRPYRLAFDADLLKRQIAFGWPILASALPLVAVHQGDRLIIARLAGMEELANYTAAFMVTMVPALIAAKVGHALMLPLFSDTLRRGQPLRSTFKIAAESTVVLAALYLAGFIICGQAVLPLVFGTLYSDLGAVISWLAAMWSLRMIQTAPGMALMAHGVTTPFFIAGMVRAAALPVVLYAASNNASIASLAAIGCAFEALSLIYVAMRLNAMERGLGAILITRSAYMAPVVLLALLAATTTTAEPIQAILTSAATCLAIAASGVAVMPSLNALIRRAIHRRAVIAQA
ncbi:MAG: oligosaccharide flippase family protein [Hyphomicrobium sp.]|nr:oligosaccharide flippase family protein [Hyphomicrobium sp.]